MTSKMHRLAAAIATFTAALGTAHAQQFGSWGDPQPVAAINTAAAAEGCPIESPDGLALYVASNRGGGLGKQDLWRVQRPSVEGAWGVAENLAAPVAQQNSADLAHARRVWAEARSLTAALR